MKQLIHDSKNHAESYKNTVKPKDEKRFKKRLAHGKHFFPIKELKKKLVKLAAVNVNNKTGYN